ncbi:MAG: phage tail protein [Sedimenticolaceae bacterium]|jgi:phage tail-like protein
MANGFVVNAKRYDPYKNFKFRILWDNKAVMGVSKISALKRTTEVVKHRSGGENSFDYKSPGRTSYEAITLERGLTHDPEFEAWAAKVHTYEGDNVMDLANYKKDLTLEFMNERGQVAFRYFLFAAWTSEFTALPELDANANAVAIESMKLEIEGWQRDTDTTEPSEG